MYGPDRVLQPARARRRQGERRVPSRRAGTRRSTASRPRWPRASATFGGESILPFCYGGSNGYLTQDAADARLFRRLGASRLLRTVCAAPTGAAADGVYGKMPGVALTDYEHARLIVVWGCNPSVSGIHLVPPIARARRQGREAGGRRPAPHAAGARGRPAHRRCARAPICRSRWRSSAGCSRTGTPTRTSWPRTRTGADALRARAARLDAGARRGRGRRAGRPTSRRSRACTRRPARR